MKMPKDVFVDYYAFLDEKWKKELMLDSITSKLTQEEIEFFIDLVQKAEKHKITNRTTLTEIMFL